LDFLIVSVWIQEDISLQHRKFFYFTVACWISSVYC